MANNTSALYTNVLLPMALKRLVERMEGLKYIRNDVSGEIVSGNKTITVPLPSDNFVARDFNLTGETVAQDINTNKVDVVIDQHKEVTFTLTDQEMLEIQNTLLLPDVVENAVKAVAKAPVLDFYNNYKKVWAFVGDNSANPYKSDDIFDAEQAMFDNLVEDQKYVALGGKAYTQLAKEQKNASTVADGIAGNALLTGQVSQISDSLIFRDQLLTPIKHIAGTANLKTLSTSGVTAAGATEIVIDGLASGDTFLEGDLIQVNDGSGQQFTVTADVTSAGTTATVAVSPAVKTEIADAASLTMIGDHNVSLMYSRDFAIFAMRALNQPTNDLGLDGVSSLQEVLVDENSGVSMRFEAHRLPKKKAFEWTFDILYKVQVLDPIYACRILPS